MNFLKMSLLSGLLLMGACAHNSVTIIPDRLKGCPIPDAPVIEPLTAGEITVYSNQLLGALIDCGKKNEELVGLTEPKWPD